VPKKVEQINDHLFIDTYKSNNVQIGVNDMTVNDSEMCVRWKDEALFIILRTHSREHDISYIFILNKVNFEIYIADRKATTCI